MGEPLGAKADEPMVGPVVEEIAEPTVEMEQQMVAPMVDMEGDLAMLFGDDDSRDDSLDDDEVWEVNEEWLMALVTPPLMPVMPPPSTFKVGGPSTAAAKGHSFALPAPGFPVPPLVIEDLYTRMGYLEYGHGQLVMASQMVQAVGRLEQVGTQMEQGQQAVTEG
ncbi:hypothetical protein Tco_1579052 [Tanacetum coccineum]